MDNYRGQLLRFQPQIIYQLQQTQTAESYSNSTVMSESSQMSIEKAPKNFAELLYIQPEYLISIEQLENFVQNSHLSLIQNKAINFICGKLTALLKENKQQSVKFFKNYSNFNSLALSIIMRQFIDTHSDLVIKNQQIKKTLFVSTEGIFYNQIMNYKAKKAIFQSSGYYKAINKIKTTWKKYITSHFDMNRRRANCSMLLLKMLHQQQFEILQSQKFMTYVDSEQFYSSLNIKKQIINMQNIVDIFNGITKKQQTQFQNAKKILSQKLTKIKQNKNHVNFIDLVKIISEDLLKVINKYSKQICDKYEMVHQKLFEKLKSHEQVRRDEYPQLNLQIQNLFQKPIRKQQVIKEINNRVKDNIIQNVTKLFSIYQIFYKVQQDLIKEQKQIQQCYAQITQIFNLESYNFYVHDFQQSVSQKQRNFEIVKIMRNDKYEQVQKKKQIKKPLQNSQIIQQSNQATQSQNLNIEIQNSMISQRSKLNQSFQKRDIDVKENKIIVPQENK